VVEINPMGGSNWRLPGHDSTPTGFGVGEEGGDPVESSLELLLTGRE
jgi:hypothetical protein